MTQVYKPSDKALRKGVLTASDRMVFTGRNEAVLFSQNGTLIEPWFRKSIDSHVELCDERPPLISIEPSLLCMYEEADVLNQLQLAGLMYASRSR